MSFGRNGGTGALGPSRHSWENCGLDYGGPGGKSENNDVRCTCLKIGSTSRFVRAILVQGPCESPLGDPRTTLSRSCAWDWLPHGAPQPARNNVPGGTGPATTTHVASSGRSDHAGPRLSRPASEQHDCLVRFAPADDLNGALT